MTISFLFPYLFRGKSLSNHMALYNLGKCKMLCLSICDTCGVISGLSCVRQNKVPQRAYGEMWLYLEIKTTLLPHLFPGVQP